MDFQVVRISELEIFPVRTPDVADVEQSLMSVPALPIPLFSSSLFTPSAIANTSSSSKSVKVRLATEWGRKGTRRRLKIWDIRAGKVRECSKGAQKKINKHLGKEKKRWANLSSFSLVKNEKCILFCTLSNPIWCDPHAFQPVESYDTRYKCYQTALIWSDLIWSVLLFISIFSVNIYLQQPLWAGEFDGQRDSAMVWQRRPRRWRTNF